MAADYRDETGAQLTCFQTTSELFAPIALRNKNFLLAGFASNHVHLKSDYLPTERDKKLTLRSFTLRIGGIKQWNSQWSTSVVMIPRISSDLRKWEKNDYQLGGAILVTKQQEENLWLKVGLYYNREHFGNYFMPLVGVDWRTSDRLNIFGVLPSSMKVEYQLADQIYTGLAWRNVTTSYRLQGGDYVREGDPSWGHIRLSAFLSWYALEDIVINLDAGHSVSRRYRLHSKQHDLLPNHEFNRDSKNGIFISLGLAYRLRRE
ncbi:MAG: DUF6268 family outer membrane beta-barrel protein [Saprospiraceae bacterium]|nr:DUF6268 family outer membrane beta-barrel protein [Saprospiraceae bacterium]